jgi:hypothetical protein
MEDLFGIETPPVAEGASDPPAGDEDRDGRTDEDDGMDVDGIPALNPPPALDGGDPFPAVTAPEEGAAEEEAF